MKDTPDTFDKLPEFGWPASGKNTTHWVRHKLFDPIRRSSPTAKWWMVAVAAGMAVMALTVALAMAARANPADRDQARPVAPLQPLTAGEVEQIVRNASKASPADSQQRAEEQTKMRADFLQTSSNIAAMLEKHAAASAQLPAPPVQPVAPDLASVVGSNLTPIVSQFATLLNKVKELEQRTGALTPPGSASNLAPSPADQSRLASLTEEMAGSNQQPRARKSKGSRVRMSPRNVAKQNQVESAAATDKVTPANTGKPTSEANPSKGLGPTEVPVPQLGDSSSSEKAPQGAEVPAPQAGSEQIAPLEVPAVDSPRPKVPGVPPASPQEVDARSLTQPQVTDSPSPPLPAPVVPTESPSGNLAGASVLPVSVGNASQQEALNPSPCGTWECSEQGAFRGAQELGGSRSVTTIRLIPSSDSVVRVASHGFSYGARGSVAECEGEGVYDPKTRLLRMHPTRQTAISGRWTFGLGSVWELSADGRTMKKVSQVTPPGVRAYPEAVTRVRVR